MTRTTLAAAALVLLTLSTACGPTIKLEAPDKPIVINLNVKIDQEVRVRLEQDAKELITENPGGIFGDTK